MEVARESNRSVSVKPGNTLLMVMHGANSRDKLFAHEAIAPRSVLESPMLGIGSRTEVEMMLTILPMPDSRIAGTTICVI